VTEFQLIGYLLLLTEADVAFLIVGGVSARLQGAATTTQDIDIMPESSPENLARLARALSTPHTEKKASDATSYTGHSTVDPMEFRTNDVSSYRTTHGVIDVIMELRGVGGYDFVLRHAKRYEWQGRVLMLASLDDIIVSKETSDRAKDWRAMDALHHARRRLQEQPDPYELHDGSLDVTNPPDAES
jgi:hypothetical protein